MPRGVGGISHIVSLRYTRVFTLKSFDNQRRGRRYDSDGCLTILNGELDRYP